MLFEMGIRMRFRTRSSIFLRVALSALALVATCSELPAQSLPATEAETVAGARASIAQLAHGQRTLLVMSFSREAGPGADEWRRTLASDPSFASLNTYEVAMLQAAPGFVRSLIKSSLRHQLNPNEQQHYLILQRDEPLWRSFSAVSNDKQPVLLLLNGEGQLIWRGQGRPSVLMGELKEHLK